MSHEIPPLPEIVLTLAPDVLEELLDFDHVQREHGKRTCYTAGCRGPLCRRADREENRERYAAKRAAAGKGYTPSDLRRTERDNELDNAFSVYSANRRAIEIFVRLTRLYQEVHSDLAV